VADADGARNMSFRVGIGSSYVPNEGIPRDSLSDILAINDDSRSGGGGLCPQERKRHEYETFHDKPSVSPAPFDRIAALSAPSMPTPERIAHLDGNALRDFNPGYDRSGSNSTDLAETTHPFMSAVPPIASEFRRRRELTQSARFKHGRSQGFFVLSPVSFVVVVR